MKGRAVGMQLFKYRCFFVFVWSGLSKWAFVLVIIELKYLN